MSGSLIRGETGQTVKRVKRNEGAGVPAGESWPPKGPALGGLAISGADFRSSPFGLRYEFGYARQPATGWKFISFPFNCPDQLEKER